MAEGHVFVLRAEAAYRLGQHGAAVDDVELALKIAPDDVIANRRMLAWSNDQRQSEAAASLIANDTDQDVIRRAMAVLRSKGEKKAFAAITVLDGTVEGWVAWSGNGPIKVAVTSLAHSHSIVISADPNHPLRLANDHAASFQIARPRSNEPQSIALFQSSTIFLATRCQANEPSSARSPYLASEAELNLNPTVIVPVFSDYQSTKACLESLLESTDQPRPFRVIVVNDASPDARIVKYLDTLKDLAGIRILTNGANVGFVGSINRALNCANNCDVVLLNADTIVPPNFIDRLRAAAYSSADIGTVTPLSNNGEFCSFPGLNRASPIPTKKAIVALDRRAHDSNSGRVVDIPNGIGFCLFITSACRNAVHELSESYHRGYLEDADMCLRAREAGFRNVCATSIYVGHAGSRSFQQEKRALVVRNLRTLEQRFPNYRAECAAFARADPLQYDRDRLERAVIAGRRHLKQRKPPKILLTGPGAVKTVALARAQFLIATGEYPLVLEARYEEGRTRAKLYDPAGGIPQSIVLDFKSEFFEILSVVRNVDASAFEIIDPAHLPTELIDFIKSSRIRIDVLISDAGLLCPPRLRLSKETITVRKIDRKAVAETYTDIDGRIWWANWRDVLALAGTIYAPCDEAYEFSREVLGLGKVKKAFITVRPRVSKKTWPPKARSQTRLGVVVTRCNAEEFSFIHELAISLKNSDSNFSVVVLGATLDDIRLMKIGNVYITGSLDAAEFDRTVQGYDIGQIVVDVGQPLFGHPLIAAALQAGVPVARFAWTAGKAKQSEQELRLDAWSALSDNISTIVRWALGGQ